MGRRLVDRPACAQAKASSHPAQTEIPRPPQQQRRPQHPPPPARGGGHARPRGMLAPGAGLSLFVLYPNREPVLRELPAPQSLAELREALEVFDDQQLLVSDRQARSQFAPVESPEQLYDGASLRITVPRRRIFVSLNDHVRNRPVVWYPGAGADQIESAIVKACGLPLGTPIELVDGDVAVVISATIPNDSSLTAVPLVTERGHCNGAPRHDPTPVPERVPRSGSVRNAASPTGRGNSAIAAPAGSAMPRPRSTTPQSGGTGREGGHPSRGSGRPMSPARGGASSVAPPGAGAPAEGDPVVPPGRISAPDEHCVHILAGHTGFVLSLCTVGDVLFTGSQDCNVMIWDLNNLQYIGTLTGHRGFVKCMVATLAKKLLISGSQDKTIKVWSLETFSSTKTLYGHTSEVNSLAILDGPDVLVSGGEDRSIRVWDMNSLSQLTSLDQAHMSGIFAVAQLDQGIFVSASRDRTMKLWLSSTWQARRTLGPPHFDGVTDIAVGARRGRFYSVSRDRSIRRWDSRSFENDLQQAHAHGDWITSAALSTSENMLFTGGKDCIVKVWDTDLHCKDHLQGHRGPISSLITIDNHLFSASHDRTVRVWRVDHFES